MGKDPSYLTSAASIGLVVARNIRAVKGGVEAVLRFSAQGVAVVAGADVALQVLDVRGGAIKKEPLAGAGAVCRGEQAARARGAGETVAAGADVALQVLDVRGGAIGKEPLAGAGTV